MKFKYQRWLIKTSLIYLFIGILIGLLIFLSYRFPSLNWILNFKTVHVHLILMGSVIQVIMGVALWMFPRKKEEPHITTEREGIILYILFNLGTILRSISEPFTFLSTLYFLALLGMLGQTAGILYFLFLIFKRIRSPGYDQDKKGI